MATDENIIAAAMNNANTFLFFIWIIPSAAPEDTRVS